MRKTLKAVEVNYTFYRWADKATCKTGNNEEAISIEFYGRDFNVQKLSVHGHLNLTYKDKTYRIPGFSFSLINGIQQSIISELMLIEDMYYICSNEGNNELLPIQVKLLIESYKAWNLYPERRK